MELIINNTSEEFGRVLLFSHELPYKKKCKTDCYHQRFIIDKSHGSVECSDCGEIISAFHAISIMAQRDSRYFKNLERMRQEAKELKEYSPFLRAVKKLESIWRGKYLPGCPHCHKGIEAEELANSGFEVRKPKKINLELI